MLHRMFFILLVMALPALAQDKPAIAPAAAPAQAEGTPPKKAAALPARAEDTLTDDPAALVTARKAYDAKVKAVVDPLKADYLKKLESMKKDFGAKGDVASALAIQREIDSLTQASTATIVGKWSWSYDQTIEIKGDGTGKDNRGDAAKWACVDKKTRRYKIEWAHGFIDWCLMSADGSSLTVASHNQKNNSIYRFNAQRLPEP
jgi:hypothetical protein